MSRAGDRDRYDRLADMLRLRDELLQSDEPRVLAAAQSVQDSALTVVNATWNGESEEEEDDGNRLPEQATPDAAGDGDGDPFEDAPPPETAPEPEPAAEQEELGDDDDIPF